MVAPAKKNADEISKHPAFRGTIPGGAGSTGAQAGSTRGGLGRNPKEDAGAAKEEKDQPGRPVAHNLGLLCLNNALLCATIGYGSACFGVGVDPIR